MPNAPPFITERSGTYLIHAGTREPEVFALSRRPARLPCWQPGPSRLNSGVSKTCALIPPTGSVRFLRWALTALGRWRRRRRAAAVPVSPWGGHLCAGRLASPPRFLVRRRPGVAACRLARGMTAADQRGQGSRREDGSLLVPAGPGRLGAAEFGPDRAVAGTVTQDWPELAIIGISHTSHDDRAANGRDWPHLHSARRVGRHLPRVR